MPETECKICGETFCQTSDRPPDVCAICESKYKVKTEIVKTDDPVNHPQHYTQHPSGVECIQITEHMNFCLGNAIKYIWRADKKNGLEDLKKAIWYIEREIQRRNTPTK